MDKPIALPLAHARGAKLAVKRLPDYFKNASAAPVYGQDIMIHIHECVSEKGAGGEAIKIPS
jgi:hypothetical protein